MNSKILICPLFQIFLGKKFYVSLLYFMFAFLSVFILLKNISFKSGLCDCFSKKVFNALSTLAYLFEIKLIHRIAFTLLYSAFPDNCIVLEPRRC